MNILEPFVSTSDWFYAIVSGWGADLLGVGVVITWYKRNKCHTCWRLTHHKVEGTHWKTCHIHLPDHSTIRAEHKKRFPLQNKILNKEK